MSDLRKAAERALKALDGVLDTYGEPLDLMTISGGTYEALYCRDAITALRAALAQPERKPLTDDQIDAIVRSNVTITDPNLSGAIYMSMRMVEAAHGIGGNE